MKQSSMLLDEETLDITAEMAPRQMQVVYRSTKAVLKRRRTLSVVWQMTHFLRPHYIGYTVSI